jgi:DNA-nicking Smr family endonuclease
MSGRKNDQDSDDREIWESYAQRVKRIGTAKLKPVLKPAPHPAKARPATMILIPRMAETIPPPPSPTPLLPQPLTFDRKIERQLRDGSFVIEARLDLHGMTQAQAHRTLAHFVTAQHRLGHRRLLVITGKGRDRQGVLRTHLQSWLESLPEARHILTLRNAAPRHGGEGAFYVLLKKARRAQNCSAIVSLPLRPSS